MFYVNYTSIKLEKILKMKEIVVIKHVIYIKLAERLSIVPGTQ